MLPLTSTTAAATVTEFAGSSALFWMVTLHELGGLCCFTSPTCRITTGDSGRLSTANTLQLAPFGSSNWFIRASPGDGLGLVGFRIRIGGCDTWRSAVTQKRSATAVMEAFITK